jgi:hypothetical protein
MFMFYEFENPHGRIAWGFVGEGGVVGDQSSYHPMITGLTMSNWLIAK